MYYHAKFGRISSIDTSILMELRLKKFDHLHLTFKGSLKVIGTDAVWTATYDFLLVIHSSISETNGYFGRSLQIFPSPRAFYIHAEEVPLEFCNSGG